MSQACKNGDRKPFKAGDVLTVSTLSIQEVRPGVGRGMWPPHETCPTWHYGAGSTKQKATSLFLDQQGNTTVVIPGVAWKAK